MDLLAQMETFTRVVEAGNLSSAARALGLSVPAVSRQLRALETSLGAPLLLRTTRSLSVTDGGRRYYERCLRVLREVEAAQESARPGSAAEGVVTVTAPVTLGLARVGPLLPSLFARHPGLRVDLRLEDHMADLVAEGVDVAIRAGAAAPDSASLVARRIMTYQRVAVASPKYLKRRGEPRTPDALARHDALVHVGASPTAGLWRFSRDGSETAVEVRGALRCNAPYALRDACVAGLGVALLPAWLVEDDVTAGRLRVVLRAYETPAVAVSALYRTELRGAPRVRAFVDHLAAACAPEAPTVSAPRGPRASPGAR